MRKSLTINDLGAFSNHTFPEMSSKKNIFLLWKKGLTGRAECAILSALWGTSLFITDRTSTKGVKTPRAWRSITASKLRSSSPIGWTHPARPTPCALASPPSVPRPESGSGSAGIESWAWLPYPKKLYFLLDFHKFLHYILKSYGLTKIHIWKRQAKRHMALLTTKRPHLPRCKKLFNFRTQGDGQSHRQANGCGRPDVPLLRSDGRSQTAQRTQNTLG